MLIYVLFFLFFLKTYEATPQQTGFFEVTIVGGKQLFSKKQTGRFPNDTDFQSICAAIDEALAA